jgi:hypothetical protein
LSRLFTALNLLPSIATLAVVRRPISRQSSTKRAQTLRSAGPLPLRKSASRAASLQRSSAFAVSRRPRLGVGTAIRATRMSDRATQCPTNVGAPGRLRGDHIAAGCGDRRQSPAGPPCPGANHPAPSSCPSMPFAQNACNGINVVGLRVAAEVKNSFSRLGHLRAVA